MGAERLEHVRGAARGRRGAVPVLDHPGAGRRGDDRRHRGDVHRLRPVAAGAYQVGGRPADRDWGRVRQHGRRQAGHLLGGLALGP